MKTKNLIYLLALVFAIINFSCTKLNNSSDEMQNAIINAKAAEDYNAMQNEFLLYYAHAKNSKTEYEVKAYIDSLPFMRANMIKLYGNEQNWEGQLAWLKMHGANNVIITQNGVPAFSRKVRSLYGH